MLQTSTAVSTLILALIALCQVCPAPPASNGPITIAADGAVGGVAIAAGIDHKKRADEFRHTEQREGEERIERLRSGCHNWPVSPAVLSSVFTPAFSTSEFANALQACG